MAPSSLHACATPTTPLDSNYPEQAHMGNRVTRDLSPPDRNSRGLPRGQPFYRGGFHGHSPFDDLKPGNIPGVIYGWSVTPPPANASLQEREARMGDYADRVRWKLKLVEHGSEGERNIKFQDARQYMEPAGYFSGGLLAAGYDPHETITVTFTAYTKELNGASHLTSKDERTYFAWEIAAGALKHDRPAGGGVINAQSMQIRPEDRNKINDLESMGAKLQHHWKNEIIKPMADHSGALAKRSGLADAYVVRGTLHSLRNDKESYKALGAEAQEAIDRTLDKNGNVVIPNIYGYPLAGYAFIPYKNYHGDYDHRPNRGLMIDLKNGKVSKIDGDDEFASWAKENRNELLRSFNSKDRQGGQNTHWPPAGDVLENLIIGKGATYPGRAGKTSEKVVPVEETFNYTQSRNSHYYLKFGSLNSGIAHAYQEMNTKNAKSDDQTQVFGASKQSWKAAKEAWGNTFGYVPVVGNTGNIVFGIHDAATGMTASDRVGGTAAAVISALQLAHEVAQIGTDAGLGEAPIGPTTAGSEVYGWKYNEQTKSFNFERNIKVSSESDIHPATHAAPNEPSTPPAIETEGVPPTIEAQNSKRSILRSIEDLPTGEALFSTPEKNVILSGELNDLNALDKKLYTFTDFNKKGSAERLNILVHGSVDPATGIAKVSYAGKLHTPEELLQTLKDAGIHPETFDNIRLLSCDSASGGDASFAAEFQRLIQRPVKGYRGTLTGNLVPEEINAAIEKVEKEYLKALKQTQNSPLTDADRALARDEAEKYVAKELAKTINFKPVKKNPYWNPFSWWVFTYKPMTFPQP
ncbi:hypothetical protein HBO41_15525 [Pseudomonas sp. WS 5146]|nr:hypothetical protein [Pseudomonas sp. WS 5146]